VSRNVCKWVDWIVIFRWSTELAKTLHGCPTLLQAWLRWSCLLAVINNFSETALCWTRIDYFFQYAYHFARDRPRFHQKTRICKFLGETCCLGFFVKFRLNKMLQFPWFFRFLSIHEYVQFRLSLPQTAIFRCPDLHQHQILCGFGELNEFSIKRDPAPKWPRLYFCRVGR